MAAYIIAAVVNVDVVVNADVDENVGVGVCRCKCMFKCWSTWMDGRTEIYKYIDTFTYAPAEESKMGIGNRDKTNSGCERGKRFRANI